MTAYFPFRGERVILRAFESEDVPALHAYLNHPELAGRRYIPWDFPNEFPLAKKQVEDILTKWSEEKDGIHLAILLRGTMELIGHAECDWGWDPHCPHVAVVIDPAHQGKGYGSQVLQILVGYLYDNTPAHNVSGWMAEWNQAARSCAKRNGFRESGRWRRSGIREGKCFDGVLCDILRPEWEQPRGGEDAA
jgi:ribosomal-protein-alanine N-acetyltransferase